MTDTRQAPVVVDDDSGHDRIADVVVIGSGVAGLAAAVSARAAGADVLVLESQPQIGGTTRKSAAWYWIPNNARMRAAGIEDARDGALRYMARVSRPDRFRPHHPTLGLPRWEYELIEAFYDNAAAAHDALEGLGAVRSIEALEFPDYFAHLPENEAPRGRALNAATPDGQHGAGEDLILTMSAAAERAGVEIVRSCAVDQLIMQAGRASGVIATLGDERIKIGARNAVIFASGGYARNVALRDELLAGPLFGTCAARGCTGMFTEIASALGLPLRTTGYPWLAPAVLERVLRDRADFEFTKQLPGDSMIVVDRSGERVVNEKLQYNELALKQWEWDGRRAEYPNLFLFMIWDQPCQQHFASDRPNNPIAPVGVDDDHVLRGDTIEGLQRAIDRRLDELGDVVGGWTLSPDFSQRLAASIGRFDDYAREGKDLDFLRGETPIELHFNASYEAPRVTPGGNPTLHPFAEGGPLYATIIVPGALDTRGGPVTDAQGRILGADGRPIAGLYGAGNCVASPSARAYWGAGATIGPAMTFGYLAGRHAAAEPPLALDEGSPHLSSGGSRSSYTGPLTAS